MKKPSEVELVAMALLWATCLPEADSPEKEWAAVGRIYKDAYRRTAREFLRALRGGR